MAITEAQEEQAAAFRARKRQDRAIPWLIRTSDGTIYPNVPLIARKPNFRPYTGDLKASLEERMAYVEACPVAARSSSMPPSRSPSTSSSRPRKN